MMNGDNDNQLVEGVPSAHQESPAPHAKKTRSKTNKDEDIPLTFPQKLMDMLEDPESEGIAGWLPNGKAFRINDEEEFTNKLLPKYFKRLKLFPSFRRRLNRWGFEKFRKGPNDGAFYHRFFAKGDYTLLLRMGCRDESTAKRRRRQAAKGEGESTASDPDEDEERTNNDHSQSSSTLPHPYLSPEERHRHLLQGRILPQQHSDNVAAGATLPRSLNPSLPLPPASSAFAALGAFGAGSDVATLMGRSHLGLTRPDQESMISSSLLHPSSMLAQQQRIMDPALLSLQSVTPADFLLREQNAALAAGGGGSREVEFTADSSLLTAQLMALHQHHLLEQAEQAHMRQQLNALMVASRDMEDAERANILLASQQHPTILHNDHPLVVHQQRHAFLQQHAAASTGLLPQYQPPSALLPGTLVYVDPRGGLEDLLLRQQQQRDLAASLAASGHQHPSLLPLSSTLSEWGSAFGNDTTPAALREQAAALRSSTAHRPQQQQVPTAAAASIPNALPPPADGRLSILDRSRQRRLSAHGAASSRDGGGTKADK